MAMPSSGHSAWWIGGGGIEGGMSVDRDGLPFAWGTWDNGLARSWRHPLQRLVYTPSPPILPAKLWLKEHLIHDVAREVVEDKRNKALR